jgi:2-polyprenyl-3-methyl-5-hydroxy-6-metoxy-1,4-benzoquinol methylase
MSPMPSVAEMQRFADAQYKEGAYGAYIKAKQLKLATFEKRIDSVRELLPQGKIRHLDVGCSAGFMIEVGLRNGFDSYGVEFSLEAISFASPDIRARITQGDVNQLNGDRDELFDLITCFDIIEHVQSPRDFLHSLKKLLKPNGLLVVTTPDTKHFVAKLMGRSWPMLQPFQHTILFSRTSLNQTLAVSGFQEIKSTSAFKILTFEYLIGQLQQTSPLLAKLSALVNTIVPKSWSKKPLALNISEFMSISRAL